MKPRVLITRRLFSEALELLRRHAVVETLEEGDDGPSEEELVRLVRDRDGLVCQLTDRISAKVIEAAARLKIIANVAVGHDNIDLEAATRRRIAVTNTPDVLTATCADFTFALLLACARRVVEGDRFLRSGRWRRWDIGLLCGHDVHGRTLGLVGLGRIGREMVPRARGFGMRVLYHARGPAGARAGDPEVQAASLETLLRESDFVSLHVPLTHETRRMIGARELARMKESAILINTSRGAVVDEAALADALLAGGIAGAALDVFENEPHVEPRLLDLPNVVLSPHMASASLATRRRMCVMAAENVIAVLEGRRPPHLVNTGLVGSWPP